VKVTLSIDREVVERIRERAVGKRGNLRTLSEEVEDVLRDSLATEQVLEGLKAMCCGRQDHLVTFEDVDAADFPGAANSNQILRQMRRRGA